MTLDEAIQHCEEVAEENEEIYEAHCRIYSKEVVERYPSPPCKKCAEEHHQLAEWLKELKAYRKIWSKLGMWLADTRLAIAPDETLDDVDEKLVRVAQVDMIDTVLEWMDKQEVRE